MTHPTPCSAHVVLVNPEIPWNTGNAGRSCLAFGARLHLVRPLGFSLDDKAVRRAGLDYWAEVDPLVHEGWPSFEAWRAAQGLGPPWLVTPEGERTLWEAPLEACPVLVFGRESRGLPEALRAAWPDRRVRVPTLPSAVRSLNVSTVVGIALAERARRGG